MEIPRPGVTERSTNEEKESAAEEASNGSPAPSWEIMEENMKVHTDS